MANFLLFFSTLYFCQGSSYDAKIEHRMNWLNFTFENSTQLNNYMNQKLYENCMPAGIKISANGTIFVSVPRWKPGVPSTLNVFEGSTNNVGQLRPFPSLEGNLVGDPNALQSVLGFEIDLDDNIWVLDQALVNNVFVAGAAKLNKYKLNGELIQSFNLTDFTNEKYSFLNDLVLDTKNNFIYISDSGALYPGFIVVDLNTNNIWRTLTNHSSTIPDPSLWIVINEKKVYETSPTQTGVDGIALSCDRRTLYYTPLTSRTLHYIDTSYLRSAYNEDISGKTVTLGYKKSASDGLMGSEKGKIYITAIELNSVLKVDDISRSPTDFHYADFKHVINSPHAVWPDTLGFYNKERRLYAMCNQLQNFMSNQINFLDPLNGDANFYIWSAYVDDRSYLEGCDYSSTGTTEIGFPTWAALLLVICLFLFFTMIGCVVRHFILAKRRRHQALIS